MERISITELLSEIDAVSRALENEEKGELFISQARPRIADWTTNWFPSQSQIRS